MSTDKQYIQKNLYIKKEVYSKFLTYSLVDLILFFSFCNITKTKKQKLLLNGQLNDEFPNSN